MIDGTEGHAPSDTSSAGGVGRAWCEMEHFFSDLLVMNSTGSLFLFYLADINNPMLQNRGQATRYLRM